MSRQSGSITQGKAVRWRLPSTMEWPTTLQESGTSLWSPPDSMDSAWNGSTLHTAGTHLTYSFTYLFTLDIVSAISWGPVWLACTLLLLHCVSFTPELLNLCSLRVPATHSAVLMCAPSWECWRATIPWGNSLYRGLRAEGKANQKVPIETELHLTISDPYGPSLIICPWMDFLPSLFHISHPPLLPWDLSPKYLLSNIKLSSQPLCGVTQANIRPGGT